MRFQPDFVDPTRLPWEFHGTSVGFPWDFRETSVRLPSSYGISMGLPWDFVVPMVIRCSHRSFMGLL